MSETKNGKVKVTIDGKPVEVDKGTVIIEAARQAGITVPHYCYDPDLTIVASCRLCLVEIEKVPKLVPSCSTPVNEGQIIFTNSQKVLDARKMQMEFLLVQHPLDCPICDQGGECKLQEYSMNHGTDDTRFRFQRRTFPKPDIGPFVDIERNRCILCSRCVRFMDEVAGDAELTIVDRGNHAYISTFMDQPLKNEFAGNTIDICPVGALTSKVTRFRGRVWELKNTPSISSLCSCGCNIHLQHRNRTHEILRIVPRENGEVNHRWISDIERFGFDRFNSDKRETQARLKNEKGEMEISPWGKVINQLVTRWKEIIQKSGASSIAGIISPRFSNETLFLFQQFMRELIGSNNIDHRTEHEISNNDDGYITSVALGAANQPFAELKNASTICLIGADLPNENPILYLQTREQSVKHNKPIYTAHHRPTRLDRDAAESLSYRPGSEGFFIAGLLQAVADNKGVTIESLDTDIEKAATETGLSTDAFHQLAKTLVEAKNITILLGESAFDGHQGQTIVQLAAELAKQLKTADRSTLPLSLLLPQMNSRGAADMGCYPHREFGFAPVKSPGKNTTEILDGCINGSIQSLILFGSDLLNEYPDRQKVKNALETVPFLVVADTFKHDTAHYAEAFLPLSTCTEEDGTYTNLAGRIQRAEKALPQVEGTLAAYQLLLALGERWGKGWRQVRPTRLLEMLSQAVPHYNGLTWDAIGSQGKDTGTVTKTNFESNSSLFKICNPSMIGEAPQEYSFRLVRGRFIFDLCGDKRFAPSLVERSEPCVAEINPDDANKLDINEKAPIKLMGAIGKIELPVRITSATHPGCITILGRYDDIPLNGIAAEQAPWVTIQQ